MAEEAVSDFANSQVPGLGDALSLLGPSKKRGNGAAKDAGHSGRNSAGASCPTPLSRNSFTGDTTVLMADGSRKPIQDIRLGDKVLATNPLTGETAAKEVTDVRSYKTDATLYEVHVGTDSGVGKIVATDEHPFWVTTVGRWIGTEDLKPGYRFLTADNRPATMLGKRTFAGSKLVYNLTVDGLHTYFVGAAGRKAAAADLLVHNEDPEISIASTCDIPGLQRAVDEMTSKMGARAREGTTVGGLLVSTGSGLMGLYAVGATGEISEKQMKLAE
ncbi:Hint domain-containing protein [Lentzea jiangxiensis]|uniref:Hint domain-containing protein n=1 Tax=Lentzea jiangxiensis TaxID=641025 RepID=UPI00115F8803|nr:Hint domain-containing protein [Lentzea jiangxiensis]